MEHINLWLKGGVKVLRRDAHGIWVQDLITGSTLLVDENAFVLDVVKHIEKSRAMFFPIKKGEEVEELKVTKEAVLRAAQSCGAAEGVLKELFPEAFIKSDLCDVTDWWKKYISIRTEGEFMGKAFYLSDAFNWTLETDSDDYSLLVPRRKYG